MSKSKIKSQMSLHFWEEKSLDEMTREEWEVLCDGCGKCCLHKIDEIESGKILYTRVACQFLDINTCRCRNYARRSELISDCVDLTPELVRKLSWLPESCAYRRISEGRGLAWWHPLISGSSDTVRSAGVSVCDYAVPEKCIHLSELESYVIDWINQTSSSL
ncbi:MAG: YcgN family cysteine cluster protein [Brevefilum sp.]